MTPAKRPPVPRHACSHNKVSQYVPGHTHQCGGVHQDGMHMCVACRRWFA